MMKRRTLKNACFECLNQKKLPTELIYEIIKFVPRCKRCKSYPTNIMTKCGGCDIKQVCIKCTKACHDCNVRVCKKCRWDFKGYAVCRKCEKSTVTCYICKLNLDALEYNNHSIVLLTRCHNCFQMVCKDCIPECCGSLDMRRPVLCNECTNVRECQECQYYNVCDVCSYKCRGCLRQLCGACKDEADVYYGMTLCYTCREDYE